MKNNKIPIIFSILLFIGDQITKYLINKRFFTTFVFQYKFIIVFLIIIIVIISILRSSNYSVIQKTALWVIISGYLSSQLNNTKIFQFDIFNYCLNTNIGYIAVAISALIMLISILLKDRSFH